MPSLLPDSASSEASHFAVLFYYLIFCDTPENLTLCNHRLKEIAEKYGCRYLDCNEALVDEHGEQKSEYAIDGVHMYANGYLNVFKSLKSYL